MNWIQLVGQLFSVSYTWTGPPTCQSPDVRWSLLANQVWNQAVQAKIQLTYCNWISWSPGLIKCRAHKCHTRPNNCQVLQCAIQWALQDPVGIRLSGCFARDLARQDDQGSCVFSRPNDELSHACKPCFSWTRSWPAPHLMSGIMWMVKNCLKWPHGSNEQAWWA